MIDFDEILNGLEKGRSRKRDMALVKAHAEIDSINKEHVAYIDDCEYIECSICGGEFYDGDNDTFDKPYNYCPNCGAKMDGVQIE